MNIIKDIKFVFAHISMSEMAVTIRWTYFLYSKSYYCFVYLFLSETTYNLNETRDTLEDFPYLALMFTFRTLLSVPIRWTFYLTLVWYTSQAAVIEIPTYVYTDNTNTFSVFWNCNLTLCTRKLVFVVFHLNLVPDVFSRADQSIYFAASPLHNEQRRCIVIR